MRIKLKHARAIEAVANARGFEQAATFLHTTQPVISRAIAAAEDQLGYRLFQRGWGGTEPTAQGELVLKRCMSALNLIRVAEEDIANSTGVRPAFANFLRWHQLDAVAAVAQLGSASAASKHLQMTQPAVSRSITAISDFSKQPLFKRRREGLEATSVARRLSVLRDELLGELSVNDWRELVSKQGLVGRLAIGMLPFSGQDMVARTLGLLTASNPALRLQAIPGSYNMLAQALLRGEIDCMIGILRDPPPYVGLREKFLYHEYFTLVARSEHHCHTSVKTISGLQNENWIVAPHGTPIRAFFEELFRNEGAVPPAQTCEILSFNNAEQVVMNSNSIGLLSYSDEHIANLRAGLRKVDVELQNSRAAVGLTTRDDAASNEVLGVFEQTLRTMTPSG